MFTIVSVLICLYVLVCVITHKLMNSSFNFFFFLGGGGGGGGDLVHNLDT